MNRVGRPLGFEIWDEPTHHVSARGIDDVLDCLAQRAQVEKKQVWLIDHHTLEYGGFAGVVNVTMKQDGSHLEV
jgi:energy-coupling factor transporter ATP-binding protein EcfA2